jgi:hypothetical protein
MAGISRIPRSRGVLSGLLLILLGIWGGLIPFIGPYFHYAYTPDRAWAYNSGRLWLEVLPGLATLLGGLILLASARRPVAMFGAFVAVLGGAWFVVGNLVSTLWNGSRPLAGVPAGSSITRLALEELGFFTGLGVVIVFFAALALGRCAVVGVKDAALAEREDIAAPAETFDTSPTPAATVPGYAGSASAGAAAQESDDSDPRTEESYQPADGAYGGEQEEATAGTSRFPAADRGGYTPPQRGLFTPAQQGQYSPEQERYNPEAESYPRPASQFPPGSSGSTSG